MMINYLKAEIKVANADIGGSVRMIHELVKTRDGLVDLSVFYLRLIFTCL